MAATSVPEIGRLGRPGVMIAVAAIIIVSSSPATVAQRALIPRPVPQRPPPPLPPSLPVPFPVPPPPAGPAGDAPDRRPPPGSPAAASDEALARITSLTDDEARQLVAARRGQFLPLDGLREISWTVAAILATHTGPLSMNTLEAIPFCFTEREAFTSLDGVLKPEDGVVRGRAPVFRGNVSLGGVVELSSTQLARLLSSDGSLWLERLAVVNDEPEDPVARLTAGRPSRLAPQARFEQLRGSVIACPRLRTLTVGSARLLAGQPRAVVLDGVEELQAEAAEALMPHNGIMSLGGLKTVTDEVGESLSRHRGPVLMAALETLTSAPLAAKLVSDAPRDSSRELLVLRRPRPAGQLFGDGPALLAAPDGFGATLKTISPGAAASLADSGRDLNLDRLATLDVDVARALARHRATLSLKGLARVSGDVAEALAGHPGSLLLDGIESLSVESAVALAGCRGSVRLGGLVSVPDEALARLRSNGRVVLPRRFQPETSDAGIASGDDSSARDDAPGSADR